MREALREQAIPIGQDLGSGRLDVLQVLEYMRAYDTGAGPALAPDGDEDRDGMPNAYEIGYGFDPRSDDDAGRDGDLDGRTNLQEFIAGTHPRGLHRSYLAEGAVNALFDVRLALFNPGTSSARVQLRFQRGSGGEVVRDLVLPGRRRATVTARDVPELVSSEFSTSIEADQPVVVDRTMSWDDTGYGSHAEHAITAPPGDRVVPRGRRDDGCVRAVLPAAEPRGRRCRRRDHVPAAGPADPGRGAADGAGALARDRSGSTLVPGLEHEEMSAVVRSLNGVPILAERAMYAGAAGQPFAAGHGGAAVAAPALEWFLAEGATGPYFDTFVLVGNPADAAA